VAPPALGSSTAGVLRDELGYSELEVKALRAKSII